MSILILFFQIFSLALSAELLSKACGWSMGKSFDYEEEGKTLLKLFFGTLSIMCFIGIMGATGYWVMGIVETIVTMLGGEI